MKFFADLDTNLKDTTFRHGIINVVVAPLSDKQHCSQEGLDRTIYVSGYG
jgi:hypothetical protein